MTMLRVLTTAMLSALVGVAGPGLAQDTPWPPLLIDPAGRDEAQAADLILPMPCGGGMAFQRVDVPVDVEKPLADRPFRMGQAGSGADFSDYLQPTHLRGAFNDPETGVSYYYIARYELNQGQHRALLGECDGGFKPIEARAKGGLSWFDAVDLSRRYTEWLMQNAQDSLPREGDRLGFLRLPTEPEWEFAARGGAKVDPAIFSGKRFFTEGSLTDYAAYLAPGQGSQGLSVIAGRRQPNALGLYDIYGNVEELMLEPFRLNAIGRPHGQPGGMVTRGGSVDLEEAQIYTARRNEYPLFSDFTGAALAGEFFGLRLVISSIVVSEDRFAEITGDWAAEADAPVEAEADPLATIAALLENEVDPRRQDALTGLQLEFRLTREAADASLLQATKSTLLSGAAFVETLVEDTEEIVQLQRDSLSLLDRARIAIGEEQARLFEVITLNADRLDGLRLGRGTYLLSYRASLETLSSDVDAETREAAYKSLSQDLEAQGQTQLLGTLERFWDDLGGFIEAPDLSSAQLLDLAIR